jgi:hypothetical protein
MFETDKLTVHGYGEAYNEIAMILNKRPMRVKVLEIGVEKGESLRYWQHLFPLGKITGVDINPDAVWPERTVKVTGNITSPETIAQITGTFELIVDDGSHIGADVDAAFTALWPRVSPGGFYVIEDWMTNLRDAERPGETWGECWDTQLLPVVTDLITLLRYPDSECESVTYRYGLVIVRKRA